ncbi:GIY-YIG nuclease family protein [Sphingorhabdus sp. EL138]|uniref:GIY-YIG nuclease family protein n=1 Tax=Sphingorhabdus sp. EL138 TaxID=2073156 RepID=UPI000D698118|nr:GIY-YIG nuclease family protein [Sphingorhabdus sp. EL138]
MAKPGYVYMMASKRNGATYLGVTSKLLRRAYEHRNGLIEGYSKEKSCKLLVWFEAFDDIEDARAYEWKLKKWKRAWKLDLIEKENPQWLDLYDSLA